MTRSEDVRTEIERRRVIAIVRRDSAAAARAAARDPGAELVKLFPAGRLGPGYVRDLLGPFPSARLVPTGGINDENAQAFLDAGAVAVAVGSALAGGAHDRGTEESAA